MNFEGIETTDWLTSGMTPEELATEKALAVISAEICIRRIELGWDQKRFAKEMGVSQAMVSKWESMDYNFTIGTLIKVCYKLGLEFNPEIKKRDAPADGDDGDKAEDVHSPESNADSSKLARIFKKKRRT